MDRRFLTWLMLSTALAFLYLSLRPNAPQPKAENAADQQAMLNEDPLLRDALPPADGEALAGDEASDAPSMDATPADAVSDAAAAAAEVQTDAEFGDAVPSEAEPNPNSQAQNAKSDKPQFPSRAITLGSMDPTKGYQLQVTFTTRGAGVERAELVTQNRPGKFQYRALEHDGGYLGYMGLSEVSAGLRVRTISDGSPAALASSPVAIGGLQVDDILTSIDEQVVRTVRGLDAFLETTKPGDSVSLIVERGPAGQRQKIMFTATLSEAPLDVVRTQVFNSERVEANFSRPSLRTTLGSLAGTNIPYGRHALPALRETLHMDWQLQPLEVEGGEGVEFRLPLESFLENTGRPAKLDMVKRYRLYPKSESSDGFLLDVETLIVNRNDESVKASFRQEGVAGLSLEGWWFSVKISQSFMGAAGARDVVYSNKLANRHILKTTREIATNAQKTPAQPDLILLSESEPIAQRSLNYIALDSQYFNAAVLPHPSQPDAMDDLRQAGATSVADVSKIVNAKMQATNTSFWFDTNEVEIAPGGGEASQRYQVFLGPKDPVILASHGLENAIEYGWFPWIAKPLSAILHFFYSITRNYALAIILLTVCVRGAMFPLGRNAAMNAQRMAVLQPEMAKINEKYKDSSEKRLKAMQELYAKHNFKPLAGCLPMFIQLPIFMGLYRCLSVDISLRQTPLIPGLNWCSNLAAPDQLMNWTSWMPEFISGRGTGWLGPFFNLLPIITVGLFLLQQKMLMPKATDEQTRMTQNMMQFMTVFMGVLFFKVPSGLCIYFITSSLWSLVERKLIKRITPSKSPATSTTTNPVETKIEPAVQSNGESSKPKSAAARRNREPGVEKPKSRMQEMMQLLEKPAVKSSTQRGTRKDKKRRK